MKTLSEYLSGLKRLFLSGGEVEPKDADPRKPIAIQMTATRKTRRKILRRLARERRAQTYQLTAQTRRMAKAFGKSGRVLGFTRASCKRVPIGTVVTRYVETRSATRGRVIRLAKFEVLKHGKLVAA